MPKLIKYREEGGMFQTDMANACCVDMPTSCAWCLCGFCSLFAILKVRCSDVICPIRTGKFF